MISSFEGILFDILASGSKVVRINKDMSLDAIRKTIMDVIGGSIILLNLFFLPSNLFM